MKNLQDELIEKTTEVAKDNLEDLTRPTSKAIGDNIGQLIDGIFGWMGAWGTIQKMKQKKYVNDFKECIENELEEIEADKLIQPKINIIGPALETAKYYYEENYYKEMFAKLIVANCNADKSDKVHPAFIETIKQLSPLDAKVISMFKYNYTYPVSEIEEQHLDGTITPCQYIICDFKNKSDEFESKENYYLSTSIENLIRLGIITKNKSVIELNYDYNKFKEHMLYKEFENIIEEDSRIKILKYRIELTNFGIAFFNICIN